MSANFSMPREIRQLLDQAITVEELIGLLEEFEPDAKVIFASDYGDITHTTQATPVATVEHLTDELGCTLVESGYSNSGVALEEADFCDDDNKPHEYEVIVLR